MVYISVFVVLTEYRNNLNASIFFNNSITCKKTSILQKMKQIINLHKEDITNKIISRGAIEESLYPW